MRLWKEGESWRIAVFLVFVEMTALIPLGEWARLTRLLIFIFFVASAFPILVWGSGKTVESYESRTEQQGLLISHFAWFFVFLNFVFMFWISSRFFTLDYSQVMERAPIYQKVNGVIFFHVIAGCIWTIVGMIQLSLQSFGIRTFHRTLGLLYFSSAVVSISTLMYSTINLGELAFGGFDGGMQRSIASLSFLILAIRSLMRQDYVNHGEWMIRSLVVLTQISIYRLVHHSFPENMPDESLVFSLLFYPFVFFLMEGLVKKKWHRQVSILTGSALSVAILSFFGLVLYRALY